MGVDEDEDGNLASWSPAAEQFHDPANNYATGDNDAQQACHGYRSVIDSKEQRCGAGPFQLAAH